MGEQRSDRPVPRRGSGRTSSLTEDEDDEITQRGQATPRGERPPRRGEPLPRAGCGPRGRLCRARRARCSALPVAAAMAVMTYLQAISDALRVEMRRDERVFLIGEDIGAFGGAFKVTKGFQEEFGEWRVIDAPLSEVAIVGGCTGAALVGMRPVAEMQFADFVSCAWDPLVTVAAKQHYRAGTPVPLVVRCPSGGGFSGGPVPLPESRVELRSHSRLEDRVPGDAGRCQGPARQRHRRPEPGPLLRAQASLPADQGRGARGALHRSLRRGADSPKRDRRDHRDVGRDGAHRGRGGGRAGYEDGVSVEIVDLRTLVPWDRAAVLESVSKTSSAIVLHEDTRTGRVRRRDRRYDRGGGLREPRRPGPADRRARHPRAVLSAAREAIPAAGGGRRRRASRARRSTDSRKDAAHGHRNRRRRRDAADGRLGLRRERSRNG